MNDIEKVSCIKFKEAPYGMTEYVSEVVFYININICIQRNKSNILPSDCSSTIPQSRRITTTTNTTK